MKQKGKQLRVPRTMAEISNEYQQLSFKAGQAQYQVFIYTKEVAQLNARLEAVNNEAAARQQLDKQEAEKQTSTATPTSTTNAEMQQEAGV